MLNIVMIIGVLLLGQPAQDGAEPFRQRYRRILLENQSAAGPEIYALVDKTAARLKAITDEVLAASFPDATLKEVDLLSLSREGATAREKEIARAILVAAMKSDVPRLTAQLSKAERIDRTMDDELLLEQKLPGLGQARQIARFQSGRMTLALEAGNVDAWLAAFDETLRLGQQITREPTLISGLVGIGVQAVAFDSARQMIHSGKATDQLLAGMLSGIMKYPLPGPGRAVRGERILGDDTLDYVYASGPAGMEAIEGKMSLSPPRNGKQVEGPVPKRPATRVIPDGQALGPGMPARQEHLALLKRGYDAAERLFAMPFPARRSAPENQVLADISDKSLLAKLLLSRLVPAPLSWDQYQADRTGTFVQAALERRKLNRGSFPESLADMAADLGGFPITDPYTGGTIGYVPPSRGPFEGGRDYVLYAAGVDGIDDGGKVNFAEPFAANKRGATGLDLLLNRYAK